MPRQISDQEYEAIKQQVLRQMPDTLTREEFERQIGPRMANAVAIAENTPAPLQGSALGRAMSGIWEYANPVEIAKGVVNLANPMTLVSGIGSQLEQFRKAGEHAAGGRYVEAAGHGAAGILPMVGPAAANIGEGMAQTGDIATGVGRAVGLVGPMLAGSALETAGNLIPAAAKTAMADALESGAARRITDVISPKSTTAKGKRLGNKAASVSPQLAQDLVENGAPLTRQGYANDLTQSFESARQQLDATADARLSARTFETKPLIDALVQKRQQLVAESVDASKPQRTVTEQTSPLLDEFGRPATTTKKTAEAAGRDVVPTPNSNQVALLDRAIDELRQLGPYTRYEPIRRIRQAYDKMALENYFPSTYEDMLKSKGTANAASDVTGTLRDQLAQWDPETAKANSQYALYKSAMDIVKATSELERSRPRTGRQIMARLTGALMGSNAGPAGVGVGYVVGPLVDSALSNGMTTQLKTARTMTQLANAIRSGDVRTANLLTDSLRSLTRAAAPALSNPTPGSPANSAPEALAP